MKKYIFITFAALIINSCGSLINKNKDKYVGVNVQSLYGYIPTGRTIMFGDFHTRTDITAQRIDKVFDTFLESKGVELDKTTNFKNIEYAFYWNTFRENDLTCITAQDFYIKGRKIEKGFLKNALEVYKFRMCINTYEQDLMKYLINIMLATELDKDEFSFYWCNDENCQKE